MDEKSGPLKMLRKKGLPQAQSSRLYILYFSDPRSHWVYRKSQYYQGRMRCCLMACLLKMLSGMLQNPQLPFHIHIWPKPKVKLGPTDSFYPEPPSSHVIATATNPSKSVSPIGISVSPRWDCKLSVSLRNVSVQPRWAISPTEIAMQTLCFPFVTFQSHRDERIGPTEFALTNSLFDNYQNRSHRDYVMP